LFKVITFEPEMLESRSKAQNDLDSSLVSNENNFSEILWPSGWTLRQVTWAKNYFTYDVTHKKSASPTKKLFFECRL